MHPPSELFEQYRARLFGVAYRMLGSRADAEDVVQDAWLRWQKAEHAALDSPEAWLVTVATRLSLDRLRSARREREAYVGPWLPEPILTDTLASPELQMELASEVSMALLTVLERLVPDKRAAFLLRDVFDYDYPEIAGILGKNEAAVRQLVHRAREEVRVERPRFSVSARSREQLLERFMTAATTGDREAVMALLTEDVEYLADGGGKVVAALTALRGPADLAPVPRHRAQLPRTHLPAHPGERRAGCGGVSLRPGVLAALLPLGAGPHCRPVCHAQPREARPLRSGGRSGALNALSQPVRPGRLRRESAALRTTSNITRRMA